MWHVTRDKWWGINILKKIQLPSSYGLGGKAFEDLEEKAEVLNELMTNVYVEKPRLHRVC